MDSDVSSIQDGKGMTDFIELGYSEDKIHVDAGIVKPASIAGFAWLDTSDDGYEDGIQNNGEAAATGTKVKLVDKDGNDVKDIDGNPVTEVTVNNDGTYKFDNLAPGDYRVKFMFQPAEEIFAGSKMMIENEILKNPQVDRALAFHTALDRETGSISYNEGYVATSSDNFKITIKGKGGHGAYPHTTIDPINVAVNIYTNFLELIARECLPQETATLTFGMLSASSNSNIIPDLAEMQGTLRAYNPELRSKLKTRMLEIFEGL